MEAVSGIVARPADFNFHLYFSGWRMIQVRTRSVLSRGQASFLGAIQTRPRCVVSCGQTCLPRSGLFGARPSALPLGGPADFNFHRR